MGTWWYCFFNHFIRSTSNCFPYVLQPGQLHHTIWPTLTMLKIIKVPFIQRFEYIIIFLWYLIILPNICLTIWSSCCISKSLFIYHLKLHYHFYRCYIYFILVFTNREGINTLNTVLSQAGLYIVYAYIPILFVFHSLRWHFKIGQKIFTRHTIISDTI